MTTIACNLREIAGDTKVSWEGIGTDVYAGIKLFPANGCIYGVAGENCDGSTLAIEWLQAGAIRANRPEPPKSADWKLIELGPGGIALYNTYLERDATLNRFLAVGSGRKVAMYCMCYLGMTPAEAVHEACKTDHWTGAPIYVASLAKPVVRRWRPDKKRAY